MENKIKKIFGEIDKAILQSISSKPVPFEISNFKKAYDKIKEKYLEQMKGGRKKNVI